MNQNLVIGTVRAFANGKHIVVGRDGVPVHVVFDGDVKPLIGGDVIGVVRVDEAGINRMTLKRSVTEAILDGKSRIALGGSRPDLSARLLAKVLARSRTAVIAPGRGLSIERAPTSNDPDLEWAISAFRPEADRLSIALNVIDVQAVARAPWKPSSLRDLTLPADIEGNSRAMNELTRLLRTGFHPDCSRMIENVSGMRELSVNFVLPYSPFAGASGFCRDVSRMDRGHVPLVHMTISEAQRLSAARYIALALAHTKLAAGTPDENGLSRRSLHIANCFADAAAALSFLASGGRREVVEAYADLREASLHFGRRVGRKALHAGVLEEATHRSIRAALNPVVLARATSPRAIIAEAVRIARRTALPAARFGGDVAIPTPEEMESAAAAASRVAVDIRDLPYHEIEHLGEEYRAELKSLVDMHRDSVLAASRLVIFASMHKPLRFDAIFDEEIRHLPRIAVENVQASVSDALYRRIGMAQRSMSHAPDPDEEMFEFADSFSP